MTTTSLEADTKPNGPVAAAFLASGVASFVMGIGVVLNEASATIKDAIGVDFNAFLQFDKSYGFGSGVGPLSGKVGLAIIAFVVSWVIFHLWLRGKEVNFRSYSHRGPGPRRPRLRADRPAHLHARQAGRVGDTARGAAVAWAAGGPFPRRSEPHPEVTIGCGFVSGRTSSMTGPSTGPPVGPSHALPDPPPGRGTSPISVLLVDDEQPILDLVRGYLERKGWHVLTASDGVDGVDAVRREQPDVVVLDLMLPGVDGVEVCRQIRTFSSAFVVMLTAKSEEIDKLVGLAVGADDYMTSRSARGAGARIKAILRRARTSIPAAPGLGVDVARRIARVDGRPVELTRTEFEILAALAREPGTVVDRPTLLASVWGPGTPTTTWSTSTLRTSVASWATSRTIRGS
jgi:DNA-binding response OmpR family regulator